ncbi:hypothetical protein C0992_013309 [Termitomyces sp. T32_za158]|nr:hypothetical protein C0992_013309 [Termitomyces sp. T32_za158]
MKYVVAKAIYPAPDPSTSAIPASQCPADQTKCCEALQRSDGSLLGNLLGEVGDLLEGVEGLVYVFNILSSKAFLISTQWYSLRPDRHLGPGSESVP